MRNEVPEMRHYFSKFEFSAATPSADETLDCQAFDQVIGGITLHSAAG